MFWERFYEMCEQVKGKKPNAIREDILVSSSVISKWKKGECLPNGETLKRIADYLDCSVDYLLGRTDNPKSHLVSADTSILDVDYKEYTERIEQAATDFWAERIAAFKAKRQQDRDKKIQEYIENRSAEMLHKLAGAKLSDGLDIFDGAEVVESTVQHKGRKAIKQEG